MSTCKRKTLQKTQRKLKRMDGTKLRFICSVRSFYKIVLRLKMSVGRLNKEKEWEPFFECATDGETVLFKFSTVVPLRGNRHFHTPRTRCFTKDETFANRCFWKGKGSFPPLSLFSQNLDTHSSMKKKKTSLSS